MIVNIDSNNDPKYSIQGAVSLVDKLLTSENELNKRLKDKASVLPVFLLSDSSMKELDDSSEPVIQEDEEMAKDNQQPSTEVLAVYLSRIKLGFGTEVPAIYLCPERIYEVALSFKKSYNKKFEEPFSILTAKVLIHEFAHVFMDPGWINISGLKTDQKLVYKWIEESLANWITLTVFNGNEEFDIVRNFISQQPPNYRLAVKLFDLPFDIKYIETWKENKGIILTKSNPGFPEKRCNLLEEKKDAERAIIIYDVLRLFDLLNNRELDGLKKTGLFN